MEKAKHTPGPWRVAVDSYGGFNRIWSPEGDDVACCEGDGSIPRDERKANEFLIAAAPELLEALVMLRESLRGHEITSDICTCNTVGESPANCPIDRAEAAIRKAKGE